MRKVNISRMYHNCNLCETRQPKKKKPLKTENT